MKKALFTGIACAALLAPLSAQTFISPVIVGFVEENLPANSFNLLGVTVHRSTELSGSFETVATNTLTDNEADFGALLTDSTIYLLEITSGTAKGAIQELNSTSVGSSTTELTTVDDLSALGLAAGDTYQIRQADTLASIFGSGEPTGIVGASSTAGADIVWVAGPSGFSKYYYNPGGRGTPASWREVETQVVVDPANIPVVYADAFYIETKAGSPRVLRLSGEVKITKSTTSIAQGFNYVGAVYPAQSTLASSNLQAQIQSGTSTAGADIVWIPGETGFTKYYYNPGGRGTPASWKNADSQATVDATTINLPSALIIQRKGTGTDVTINPGFGEDVTPQP